MFNVGDYVILNPNKNGHEFRYSQGSVHHGDIGVITHIYPDRMYVDFEENSSWSAIDSDLVHVEEKKCYICGEKLENPEDFYFKNHHFICKHCFEKDYFVCECGREERITDANKDEDGTLLCNRCYRDRYRVFDYHEFQNWKLFKGSREDVPPYFIGKEIELEPKGREDATSVVKAIRKNINAVGMHDGSLSYGGVEVVTHPESWEYLQEHKQDYINFFEDIKSLEYGNAGGCGLHFHVTKPNENVVARVIVLLESFKNEIKKLSRRSEGQLSSWAKFLTDGRNEQDNIKYQSTKYLKDKYFKSSHDRYYALNLCNSKTIEFRFFNGVNTFEQYWGALQFIHNLMELALDESKELNTINWQDLLVGDELREQARKRDVLTISKFAKDTNDVIEKYEIALAKAKKDIKKTLRQLAKYVYEEISELSIKEDKTTRITSMISKCNDFMSTYRYKVNYLNRIVDLYNALNRKGENLEMKNIKDFIDDTKYSYPKNSEKYSKFNEKINKIIDKYESEVR